MGVGRQSENLGFPDYNLGEIDRDLKKKKGVLVAKIAAA